jgi:hypothetical protein
LVTVPIAAGDALRVDELELGSGDVEFVCALVFGAIVGWFHDPSSFLYSPPVLGSPIWRGRIARPQRAHGEDTRPGPELERVRECL